MSATARFSPLRGIADVEELERIPLEGRLLSWDANDWIRRGLDLAPDKVAIQYVADGKPDTPPVELTYRELKQRTIATANLFHALGRSAQLGARVLALDRADQGVACQGDRGARADAWL